MPMLTPSQVHVDTPLTNLSIAYVQSMEGFVADKVFPNVPVSKQTDTYYIYNREDFNRSGNVKPLAPRTRPERVGMSLSSDSYNIEVRALATDFDFQTLANEDTALNIRSAGANMLFTQMMIDREKRWTSTYFDTGIWSTEWTGVAAAPAANQFIRWSDLTNATPIEDITAVKRQAMLTSGGFVPNVMLVTRDVHDTLINHPKILARINGGATTGNPAMVNKALLAMVFEVDEYLVTDAIENTAAEGIAESNAFIASNRVALFYRPPAPGLMVPAAGYNFTWSTLDNSSGHGVEVMSYSGDYLEIEGIAEEIHACMAYDQKVVGAELGIYLGSVLS